MGRVLDVRRTDRHGGIGLVTYIAELEVSGEQHVSIGAEGLGLADHIQAGLVGNILGEAGKEVIHVGNDHVGSTVTDHRIAVRGRAGRILTADREPVVVIIRCRGVCTFQVVAEKHHQHAEIIRSTISEVVGVSKRPEKAGERGGCAGRNGSDGFLLLAGQHGAALGFDFIHVGASRQNESRE